MVDAATEQRFRQAMSRRGIELSQAEMDEIMDRPDGDKDVWIKLSRVLMRCVPAEHGVVLDMTELFALIEEING